ncbi:hypothetical protein K504DRAFT_423152 [Pleomassaria siparia CBS 279.74]|uniref:FAD-binding FR-type domain-containing protein n=1 Tax=Pleomassaria siparia CBS 279.74 TaxID=1314801 RepID=A0A6G1KJZ0_9PLEO|nr:hypothetical protein K504DRAFT_423152 [Pleomassaria siparia CBS 279.74]
MTFIGYDLTLTLDADQKKARRHLLELYPLIAQWSALAIFALFQLSYTLSWLSKRGLDYERPRSPSFNKCRDGSWAWLRKSQQGWDRMLWWMQKPVISSWGTRGEWVGGGIWTTWLLYLCIANTGNDYLHLTKRFGIIGASQLPLHYLLAMRSPYSPVQWLTRLSHEQLKASHQISGRIIYFFFILHTVFYTGFFISAGVLGKRIKDKDVILGLISIILFTILSTTALQRVRRWNYPVFFISHVVLANVVLVSLWFHVTHIRLYILETIVVNAVHQILRYRSLKAFSGTIELLPGTNLVQIRIPLTSMNAALAWKPGQHVYLSRPTGKAYSAALSDQFLLRNQTNPFTVASIPVKDKELLLVARTINGNTKKLAELARSLSNTEDGPPNIPLTLEGPYGASTHLPDFSTFDNILLVAGGVGATFVVPIYRSIIEFHDAGHAGRPHVRFIWAVKKQADTQWAFTSPSPTASAELEGATMSHRSSGVEVYVTRPSGAALHIAESGEEMELAEFAENDELLSAEEQREQPRKGIELKTGRPNISAIVDQVFSKGSRIAVVSCGPRSLTRKLSSSVEQWVVHHDVQVYYHEETFGW